jgi:hypothetical protein
MIPILVPITKSKLGIETQFQLGSWNGIGIEPQERRAPPGMLSM